MRKSRYEVSDIGPLLLEDLLTSAAPTTTINYTNNTTNITNSTLVLNLNFMPCFLRILVKFLTVSLSMPGVMASRNSTTVTSVPRRRQTDPISRPITPPVRAQASRFEVGIAVYKCIKQAE